MAIAPGSTSNTPTLANRTNSTITAPSGITNGDLLVAFLHVGDGTALPALAVTPPAGWTEVTNSPSAVAKSDPYTVAMHVYTKVASGESGNYTFSHTAADTEGFMYRLTGADTINPIDVAAAAQIAVTNANGSTTTFPSITTVTNGAFLIFAESDWAGPGTGAPSGTTPSISARRIGSISWIGDGTQTTAGATSARTRANGNSSITGSFYEPWASIVVAIRPATSGSPYTLAAATGSFSLSGQATRLAVGRKLVSAAGSFALTGVAAGLKVGRKVAAASGTFNLTGQSATLRAARKLSASPGAFALTGINATLTYTPAGNHYTLSAAAGSFTLTGQAAALRAARKLALASGSFALSGQSAAIRYGRVLPAGSGSFALSGKAASLRAARKLAAAKGSFALTGIDATLTKSVAHSYTLSCAPGSFLFTGYAASLFYAPIIGKTNPLGRLNMYTGTLGAMSNREDWIVNIAFTDDEGNAFDISAAQSIGVYICKAGCPNDPVLSATLGNGILLLDNFTIQWAFTEQDMQRLHPSQYDVFCRIEISNITTQVLSASVAIVEGGPRQ